MSTVAIQGAQPIAGYVLRERIGSALMAKSGAPKYRAD